MNEDSTKKIIQYLEKKCNAVRCFKHRAVNFNADTLQKMVNLTDSESGDHYSIVDYGANTGLKGSTSIFIEHTFHCANVNGFDSNGTTAKDLPIGTCVTAALNSAGETVILLEIEQIDYTSQNSSMISPNQMRQF